MVSDINCRPRLGSNTRRMYVATQPMGHIFPLTTKRQFYVQACFNRKWVTMGLLMDDEVEARRLASEHHRGTGRAYRIIERTVTETVCMKWMKGRKI